jgi:hypothetical protein
MLPKTGIYDALEPKLYAGEIELLDITELQEPLLTLVAAGALWLVSGWADTAIIAEPIVVITGYDRFSAIGGLTADPDWRSVW